MDLAVCLSSLYPQGREEGKEEGRQAGILEGQRTIVLRLLFRTVGELPDELKAQIDRLSLENLAVLNEVFLDFTSLNDLVKWLRNCQG